MSFESLKYDLKNPESAGNGLISSCLGFCAFGDFRCVPTRASQTSCAASDFRHNSSSVGEKDSVCPLKASTYGIKAHV